MGLRAIPRLAWPTLVVVAAAALLLVATADLPFFSESYSHLQLTSEFDSVLDSFALDLVPFRPFQHAYFYLLQVSGDPNPMVARMLLLLLHLGSAMLIYLLARQLGCSPGLATLATVAFLLFPNTKTITWAAAIGWPGQLACLLAGLCLVNRHLDRPSWLTGSGQLLFFVLAVCFHQGGVLVPLAYALIIWARGTPVWQTLRNPWFLTTLLIFATYCIYLGLLREQRFHHMKSLDSLPANLVRGSLALCPEFIRQPCVEGLRGQLGIAGYGLGAVGVLLVLVVVFHLLRRGNRVVRITLLLVILEIALPVLTTGFQLRHAYVASAFLACALAAWLQQRTILSRKLILAGLLGLWTFDQVRDALEYRQAGVVSRQLLTRIIAVGKEAGETTPVTLVEAPYWWGNEGDIPLFNYGLRKALVMAGGENPWRTVKVSRHYFSTDFEQITEAELDDLISSRSGPVLRYVEATTSYEPCREGY